MHNLVISGMLVNFFNMIVHIHTFLQAHYHALQNQLAHSGGHYRHALRMFRYWANVLYRKMS